MDDWHNKLEGVVRKKPDQNSSQHQQIIHFANRDNLLNHNGSIKQTRWDSSTQVTHMSQSKFYKSLLLVRLRNEMYYYHIICHYI